MKKHNKRRGFLQFVLPALGLLLNQDAQRKQNNANNRAMDAQSRGMALQEDQYNTFSRPALEKLMSLASGYDPVAESRAGVQAAERSAGESIGRALRQYDVNYRLGGGTPGQTTNYASRQAATVRPIAARLGDIVADAMSNQTAKKMQMFQAVLGQAPAGSLSNAYFQNADFLAKMAGNQQGGDFSGVSRMLADLMRNQGGAGGSGDARGILGNANIGTTGSNQVRGLFN